MSYRSILTIFSFVFYLNLFGDVIQDNASTQPNSDQVEEMKRQLDPGIAIIRIKQEGRFADEFCRFVLETAPQAIKDKIELLADPDCPPQIRPKKILLYGPSGSGKTTLAQIIAQAIGWQCVFVSAGLLGNEFKNSVAQNLRRAIEPYLGQPCVVVIDEIDAILKTSKNEKDLDINTPKQIWEIFDLCAQIPNIVLIGITNDLRGMDVPLQTRFAGDIIEVPLIVSHEMRKKIILFHLQTFLHNTEDSYLSSLVKKTKKFSNRELEKMVLVAMEIAYLNKKSLPVITKAELEKAYNQLEKSRSLLSKINWADYEKHLQYGLQIAGLVVNIASLITNWRMAWLSYIQVGKNHKDSMAQGSQQHKDSMAQGSQQHKESMTQGAQQHKDCMAQGEHHHQDSMKQHDIHHKNSTAQAENHFKLGQAQARDIAEKQDRRAVEMQFCRRFMFLCLIGYLWSQVFATD